MFLYFLDDDQKRAFFSVANEMIISDGKIVNNEVGYLKRLIVESGLGGDVGSISVADELDLTPFTERAARVAVAVELLVIAVIDGQYHISEAGLARRTLDAFGFTDDEYDQIKRIAENIASGILTLNKLAEKAA